MATTARLGPAVALVLLLLGAALLTGASAGAQRAPTASTPAPMRSAPPFPRVATLYSKAGLNTDAGKRAVARFNLWVTDFGWWPFICDSDAACSGHTGSTVGQYVRSLNPNLTALVYMHPNGYEDGSWSPDRRPPGQGFDFSIGGTPSYLDLRWFLTYVGSSLTEDVPAAATVLRVADLARFDVGDRAIIGGGAGQSQPEMVLVTGKSAPSGPGALDVARARNSQGGRFPALAHVRGDYVKTVAYSLSDRGFLMLNTTATCPVSPVNPRLGAQTWNQFLAAFLGAKLREPGFAGLDGILLDNFVQNPIQYFNRYLELDFDYDNVAEGRTAGEALYSKGMQEAASLVRQGLPDHILVGNPGGEVEMQGAFLNGGMIEGVDENGLNWFTNWHNGDPRPFYDGWIRDGKQPRTFIYEGSPRRSSPAEIQRDYRAMRFLLALTLMNDGYFVYDEFGYGGHQTSWWYDEFDEAGQGTGYLGQPLGASIQVADGVQRRDFANGIALVNTGTATQSVVLERWYRKIRGVQDPVVNDGSLVSRVSLPPKDGIILLRRGILQFVPLVGLEPEHAGQAERLGLIGRPPSTGLRS